MEYLTVNPVRRAFTLIEILIVVVILGILAAILIPQYTDASDIANDAAVRTQLQALRGQIELYKAQQGSAPDFATDGWGDLIDNDYLMLPPNNTLAGSSDIDVDTVVSGGWLWKKKANGTYALYAVDASGGVFSE